MSELVRGQSIDGGIRIFAAVTTGIVERARQIHDLSPTASAALGRTLTAASLMGANLKNETDSVTLQFKGDGPIGRIVAVSDSESNVRGYVENPYVDLPLNKKGKLDVGGAVGKGYLNVIQDLSLKEPYAGQVPIVTGEIAEDLTYYFAKSEQIPTALSLGVLVDTDCSIKAAGGFLLQLMPGASEEDAEKLEIAIRFLPPVTDMIDGGMSATDIIFKVCDGFDMLVSNAVKKIEYKCYCSQSRMERAIISLGRDEIRSIIDEQGEAEICCQFCDRKYTFDKDKLEEFYAQAK